MSRFCWLFVGVVFVFSGLIKLNDPVGTAIKLEEYFEVFATDFGSFFKFFEGITRTLSVTLSALEVTLGVALLLRWQLHYVLRALLALCIFFGFLTFYSAAFNKVTDCGCFGEAIKLTPWTSFAKDMLLLAAIVVLLRTHERWLKPLTRRPLIGTLLVTSAAGVAVGIGVYALGHLPIFDLLAYAKGKSISQQMQNRAPYRFQYIMTKGSEEQTFDKYPTDTTWKFKQMVGPLNPEDGPKITDFRVWNDAGDYTQEILKGTKLILIIQSLTKLDRDRLPQTATMLQQAARSRYHIEPLILTSASQREFDVFRQEKKLAVPYYFADATVLKTVIRSNPGLLLLKDGVVLDKWHYHDIPSLRGIEKELDK